MSPDETTRVLITIIILWLSGCVFFDAAAFAFFYFLKIYLAIFPEILKIYLAVIPQNLKI